MRFDHRSVEKWIPNNAKVLDIGCGDGSLLALLRDSKNIIGVGVDIDSEKIQACIENNISVIEMDMAEALNNFADKSFEYVIMTQTLQVVRHPRDILQQVLRVGHECIIAFPNFAHWSNRWYLTARGKMPVSKSLPYSWFDTPNIHFFTIKDFEELCKTENIDVLDKFMLNSNHKPSLLSQWLPNTFCTTAIYRIRK